MVRHQVRAVILHTSTVYVHYKLCIKICTHKDLRNISSSCTKRHWNHFEYIIWEDYHWSFESISCLFIDGCRLLVCHKVCDLWRSAGLWILNENTPPCADCHVLFCSHSIVFFLFYRCSVTKAMGINLVCNLFIVFFPKHVCWNYPLVFW